MQKIIIVALLLVCTSPVFAEEVNDTILMSYNDVFYRNVYHTQDSVIIAGVSEKNITGVVYFDHPEHPKILGIFQTNSGGEFVKEVKLREWISDEITLSVEHDGEYHISHFDGSLMGHNMES